MALLGVPGGLAAVTLAISLLIWDYEGPPEVLGALPLLSAVIVLFGARNHGRKWQNAAGWAIASAVLSVVLLAGFYLAWFVVYCGAINDHCFS